MTDSSIAACPALKKGVCLRQLLYHLLRNLHQGIDVFLKAALLIVTAAVFTVSQPGAYAAGITAETGTEPASDPAAAQEDGTYFPPAAAETEGSLPQVPSENQLVICTSHKQEVYQPVISEFERETGIWVTVTSGGTTQMLEKVRGELEFGDIDLMFGGGLQSLYAYRDCFEPYLPAEADAIAPAYLPEGIHADGAEPDSAYADAVNNAADTGNADSAGAGDDEAAAAGSTGSAEDGAGAADSLLFTPFTALPIVFIYNNRIIPGSQAPSSWTEFLTDPWEGSISFADPHSSGTSFSILETMVQATGKSDEQVLDAFCTALGGYAAEGSGDVLTDVASGKKAVGITLEESALRAIAKGEDLSMVWPLEGTSSTPDGCAIVKNAPHAENAQRFINFFLSEDVQRYMIDQQFRRSVRKDLAGDLPGNDSTQATSVGTGARQPSGSGEAHSGSARSGVLTLDIEQAGAEEEHLLNLWDARMAE